VAGAKVVRIVCKPRVTRRAGLTFQPWVSPDFQVRVGLDVTFVRPEPNDGERLAFATYLRDVADMIDSEPGRAIWEGRA
jgi:hypothetical protein